MVDIERVNAETTMTSDFLSVLSQTHSDSFSLLSLSSSLSVVRDTFVSSVSSLWSLSSLSSRYSSLGNWVSFAALRDRQTDRDRERSEEESDYFGTYLPILAHVFLMQMDDESGFQRETVRGEAREEKKKTMDSPSALQEVLRRVY